MSYIILSINPGSTSTKIAVYEDEKKLFEKNIEHEHSDLEQYDDILGQLDYRTVIVKNALKSWGIEEKDLSAVVGRGNLLPNMKGGGYLVNEDMIRALENGEASPHASNLGALIAYNIAVPIKIPAYIYDSVSSDEFSEIAKITGIPTVVRASLCHVLNTKAVSREVAKKHGSSYEKMNLIVAHLGGGISISIHQGGRIVDAIRDDSGPFSPERAGSIPLFYIIDMCYSGNYAKEDMIKLLRGAGGLKAYLGTSDCREIEKEIESGNKKAKLLYEAQAYQISKGIGEMAPVVNGEVDYIILTGGMAHSKMMTDMITKRIQYIAPVEIAAGEMEMEALSLGALRLLKGQEKAHTYQLSKLANP